MDKKITRAALQRKKVRENFDASCRVDEKVPKACAEGHGRVLDWHRLTQTRRCVHAQRVPMIFPVYPKYLGKFRNSYQSVPGGCCDEFGVEPG